MSASEKYEAGRRERRRRGRIEARRKAFDTEKVSDKRGEGGRRRPGSGKR